MQRTRKSPKPEFIGPRQPVWLRLKFPVIDIKQFPGEGKTLEKPYAWTPAAPHGFRFGGKQFIPLYPCIAWETQNFGWVSQRGPHGLILARE
jgi:hypothetical protein